MATKKSKYNERFHSIAEEWIKTNGLMLFGGAPLMEYCKAMGIHVTSHYNWLERFPQYKKMVEDSVEFYRQAHTKKLFNSMMDSAIGGYRENTVEDVEYKPDPQNPNKPMIARKKTHKETRYYQPNTAAAIFLLSNLSPEDFVNRQRTDVNVKETKVKQLTMEQAQELLKTLEEEY